MRNIFAVRLSHHFALQRAALLLSKVRDTATLLAMAGGKITPASALGLATHAVGLALGLATRDIEAVAGSWAAVPVPRELSKATVAALASRTRNTLSGWTHCDVEGQALLLHAEDGVRAERCAADAEAQVREALWEMTGPRARLRPSDRWDRVDLVASAEGPAHPSTRADAAWSRLAPHLAAGEPRALLLDGAPRTGKSTIVRRLLDLEEARVGAPIRVLRVAVSDFEWLRPSTVLEVARFLRPAAVVVDDLDRFMWADRLLDLFEGVRQTARLVLATTNDAGRLPLALRLPGRFDELERVEGVGPEAAAAIAPQAWARLGAADRATVERWPLGLARELELRVLRRGADPAAEVRDLAARLSGLVDEKDARAKAKAEDETKAATGSAPTP